MVGEGETQAVGAEVPVEGVGAGSEGCKEGDGGGEGGEFGKRDGREPRVVEGTGSEWKSI